jgi:hypothetical protein
MFSAHRIRQGAFRISLKDYLRVPTAKVRAYYTEQPLYGHNNRGSDVRTFCPACIATFLKARASFETDGNVCQL